MLRDGLHRLRAAGEPQADLPSFRCRERRERVAKVDGDLLGAPLELPRQGEG
ncbi:hypothetical protein WMF39_28270 [Sorangium sp. So ce1504]|uniref:hypothetical protein n=1 Tax=Sorangium sp. So ce1504 TaxID=3133337 RepID=UPI003F648680